MYFSYPKEIQHIYPCARERMGEGGLRWCVFWKKEILNGPDLLHVLLNSNTAQTLNKKIAHETIFFVFFPLTFTSPQ